MADIKNLNLLPDLIKLFQKHEGYWEISQHEDSNLDIQWYPFGLEPLMTKGIKLKRCFDIQDYINKTKEEFKKSNFKKKLSLDEG